MVTLTQATRTNLPKLALIRACLLLCGSSLLSGCGSLPDYKDLAKNIFLNKEEQSELEERWESMAAGVERVLALEADMQLIVAELSKGTQLSSDPSGEIPISRTTTNSSADYSGNIQTNSSGQQNKQAQLNLRHCSSQANGTSTISSHCHQQKIGLHIGAFSHENYVEHGWLYLKGKFPQFFSKKEPLVKEVLIQNRRFQSLRVGEYTSVNQAQKICEQLKDLDQYCAVTLYAGNPVVISPRTPQ